MKSKLFIKRSKYLSKKVEIDGHKFDSKLEAEFYSEMIGKIPDLRIHERYVLQDKFTSGEQKIAAIVYEADFSYGDFVVDIKGMPTEGAKIKRKLFMFRYPHLKLKWIVKYQGKWVDYFENEKRRKLAKKTKLLKIK